MAQWIFIIKSNNLIVLSPMYLNYNDSAYLVILYHINVIIRY
jgi:hypothetical protein